jgi:hypothetical protein
MLGKDGGIVKYLDTLALQNEVWKKASAILSLEVLTPNV